MAQVNPRNHFFKDHKLQQDHADDGHDHKEKPPLPPSERSNPDEFKKQFEDRWKQLKVNELKAAIEEAIKLGGRSWPITQNATKLYNLIVAVGKAERDHNLPKLREAIDALKAFDETHFAVKWGEGNYIKLKSHHASSLPASMPSAGASSPVPVVPDGSRLVHSGSELSLSHHGERHSISRSVSTLTAKDVQEIQKSRDEEKKAALDEWEALPAEKKTKNLEKRKLVHKEVIDTEQTYVQNLHILRDNYVIPIRAHASDSSFGVTPEQMSALVSNLETLVNFHDSFLEDLRKEPEVGPVFIKYGDFFRLYTQYLNGYSTCLETLSELRSSKRFQDLLGATRKTLASLPSGLDLMSYLIMPVQRVPRYVLLLKELSRNTDPSSEEYDHIDAALSKISDITKKINEAKRQMEQMARLVDVQNRISGDIPFSMVEPHRRLIKEGPLIEVAPTGLFGSLKPFQRIVFLFNNVLLWTTDSLKFKGYLQNASATVEEDPKNRFYFSVGNSQAHVVFVGKDENDKKEWMDAITAAIEEDRQHRAQKLQVKSLLGQRKNDGHKARSELHSSLAKQLEDLRVKEDERAEAAKEKYDERSRTAEERQKALEGLMRGSGERGSLSQIDVSGEASPTTPLPSVFIPRSSSGLDALDSHGSGEKKFVPRVIARKGRGAVETPRSERPSISLIGEGSKSSLCTCEKIASGEISGACPLHPFGPQSERS